MFIDLPLCAQTGSGKTLVFLINILAKVDAKRAAVQAIVIVPTRELGIQVLTIYPFMSSFEFSGGCSA